MATSSRRARPSTSTIALIAGAVVALAAAVILIVAAVAAGSGDDGAAASGKQQFQPVTVDGDPLAAYPGNDAADPAVGATAPTLHGASFDGSKVDIAPGRPTLLAFVAHWCPHCQAEVPRLVDWMASGTVPEQLQIMAVSTGTVTSRPNYPPSAWLERESFTAPVLADDQASTAGQAYGLKGFPMLVMLDADGTVLWRYDGEITLEELQAKVAASLAG